MEFITGTVSLTSSDTIELGQACDCEIVLAFDMSRDVFRVIRLPDEVFRKLRFLEGDSSCMNKDFAMFNDCLAFIVYKDGHILTEKYFDIWVMLEYGVDDSWTKQLVVRPLLRIHRPLPFAKNGELLLLGDHYTHNALLQYNIGSQEIKFFNLQAFQGHSSQQKAMVYVESLVSFTGRNVFELFFLSSYLFVYHRLPDEVFRKLRFLEGDASCMNKDFAMFNDCLAFIVYKDGHILTEKYFDIWVMLEYGVDDSLDQTTCCRTTVKNSQATTICKEWRASSAW
nr:hypothetical protein CFP56_44545 [Quercus suber]